MTSTNDFLLGGGGKSVKFDNVGDSITGEITAAEVKQQTDIATGAPLSWDNGDPRMQLVVTLKTSLREDDDDDGSRNIYVKGSKKAGSKSLHDAVAQAVRAAGAKGLDVGGTLTVTLVGTEPSATRGFNDRKLYGATYVLPDRAAQTGAVLGTAEVAPAAAPAAPAGLTPEQVAALRAAGVDPASIPA